MPWRSPARAWQSSVAQATNNCSPARRVLRSRPRFAAVSSNCRARARPASYCRPICCNRSCGMEWSAPNTRSVSLVVAKRRRTSSSVRWARQVASRLRAETRLSGSSFPSPWRGLKRDFAGDPWTSRQRPVALRRDLSVDPGKRYYSPIANGRERLCRRRRRNPTRKRAGIKDRSCSELWRAAPAVQGAHRWGNAATTGNVSRADNLSGRRTEG